MSATVLRPAEKAWAEAIFEAVLGPVEDEGLPAFRSIDRAAFWAAIETAPGPSFGLGLRAMVAALTFRPLAHRSYGKPLHALPLADRTRFLESLADDSGYATRQMLTTMKMLASFAYFDDARVRARYRPEAMP